MQTIDMWQTLVYVTAQNLMYHFPQLRGRIKWCSHTSPGDKVIRPHKYYSVFFHASDVLSVPVRIEELQSPGYSVACQGHSVLIRSLPGCL